MVLILEFSILIILILGIIAVFVTQVLVPFRQGTRLFPAFKKTTPIAKKVDRAQEQLEEATEFVALKKQLKTINEQKASLYK